MVAKLFSWVTPRNSSTVLGRAKIAIFRADKMDFTPFFDAEPFTEIARLGVVYVSNPRDADIILSRRSRTLRKFGHYPARFAIWTDEPRFNIEQSRRSVISGVRNVVDVMNVHTGAIYRDNYHHLWNHQKNIDFDERMRAFSGKPDRACLLATYRSINQARERNRLAGPLKIRGENIDLNQTRQELAILLHAQGYCDIYGRNWPAAIAVSGESRIGNWVDAKREILDRYGVNIAIENTIARNYVTEKIWDAIRCATLPVYYGENTGIYDDFPRGSFIEAASKETDNLAGEIQNMPRSERLARYEACLRTYIQIVTENRFAAAQSALRLRIADFIEEVMSRPPEASPGWNFLRGLRGSIRAVLRPPSASTR